MASVFRVKRRRDEDPAEALRLSCKKSRRNQSETVGSQSDKSSTPEESKFSFKSSSSKESQFNKDPSEFCKRDEVESILSFAGTISSKNEPFSHHIKAAIRNTKLHKEMHPHMNSYQYRSKEMTTTKRRQTASDTSRANRYRVTSSHRAINLQLLDSEKDEKLITTETEPVKDSSTLQFKADNLLSPMNTKCDASKPQDISVSPTVTNTTTDVDSAKSIVKNDKMFCVFDIENENEENVSAPRTDQKSVSEITMNNIPMLSSSTPKAPLAESEYVYDLYYTHSDIKDIDVEAVLTVKSLCSEFMNEGAESDEEFVNEDDDSNDESNWRNDYPDEDPHFFENADELDDCYYAEDMNYTDIVDDGDLLSKYLGKSCRMYDSDNDEDEYDKESDTSSEDDD